MSIRRWKVATYSKPSWQSSPAISVRLPPRGIPPSPPTPTFGMLVHCRQPPRIAIRESLILGIDWPRTMHRIVTERRPFIAPIFLSLSIVHLLLRFPENNINGKIYKKNNDSKGNRATWQPEEAIQSSRRWYASESRHKPITVKENNIVLQALHLNPNDD